MRILVGWDDPSEAETIALFLNVDGNEASIHTDAPEFERATRHAGWDVVLAALSFPSEEQAFALFQKTRECMPDVPFVGACQQGEIMRLARFISNGLHSYVFRDPSKEYLVLLYTLLESAHTSALAEWARHLAERLREEIDSVRRLQESVIPRDLPVPHGYQVAARYEPSQIRVLGTQPVVMAGGDYYDVFSLDQEHVILIVGDAAGHGVKACMSIMTMHTLIRMIRDNRYRNTADFVTEVNRRLCDNDVVQDQGGFITLLYSALNTSVHTLEWTSAGHPMPMLQDLTTNEVHILGGEEEAGLPLAIDEDAVPYVHCSAKIPRNSRLLLYTDGLAEAFPADGERDDQFGETGIIATLKATTGLPVEEALDRLFVDSHAFTEGMGRPDDTSAVLVERTT